MRCRVCRQAAVSLAIRELRCDLDEQGAVAWRRYQVMYGGRFAHLVSRILEATDRPTWQRFLMGPSRGGNLIAITRIKHLVAPEGEKGSSDGRS